MNYDDPNLPLITSPKLLDKEVQDLQVLLKNSLPWLEAAYGLASNGAYTDLDGKQQIVPEVYAALGQYVTVLPNNFLKSMCFFCTTGAAQNTAKETGTRLNFEQELDIVFWVDLERIKAAQGYTHTHRFTQELINDVLNVLSEQYSYVVSEVETDAKKVWQGWSLDIAHTQTFKHPESGFRVSGKLYYRQSCS